MTPLTNIHF